MLSRQNGTGVEALAPFFYPPIYQSSLIRCDMITLLAESKTMAASQSDVEADIFSIHKPTFEDSADMVMAKISAIPPHHLSKILGISPHLAIKVHNLANDFADKSRGYNAINGFTGEAFRALDVQTLSPQALCAANDNLLIISSIYGLLKPDDIIKPYRSEFNKPIFNGDKTAAQFFKAPATIEFVKHLKDKKIKDIINLLPADADKCLDWKIIRAFANVNKITFRQISPDGNLKTPIAKRLKELRGLMAREIFINEIKTFEELTAHQSNHFIYSPADSKPGLPIFISD